MKNFALHAVVVHKPVTKKKLEQIKEQFINTRDKHFIRETPKSYRIRNHPKQRFEKKSFRTKVVNKQISLVFGELKPQYHKMEEHAHRMKPLKGAGVIDYFKKKLGDVSGALSSGIKSVRDYFTPRLDGYNNKSTATIKKYGERIVKSMQVYKTPLSDKVNTFLNLLSFGKLSQVKKKYGFDEFFHLALVCNIGDKNIMCQKNSVVDITEQYKTTPQTQIFNIDMHNKQFPINEMLNKTRERMGDKAYFEYDMLTHNCQNYVCNLLESVGLLSVPAKEFIYQNISEIIKEIPAFSKYLIRGTTDLDALINKLTGGTLPHLDLEGYGMQEQFDEFIKKQKRILGLGHNSELVKYGLPPNPKPFLNGGEEPTPDQMKEIRKKPYELPLNPKNPLLGGIMHTMPHIERLMGSGSSGGALVDYYEGHNNLMNHLKGFGENELMEEIKKLREQLQQANDKIAEQDAKIKRSRNKKDYESIDLININKYKRLPYYRDVLLKNPEIYEWTDETAFDKNLKKNKDYFRDYQKRFIEDWSVSTQECVILYYGVGAGKTMIAVNCAEQYVALNQGCHVYFLTPASLVLGTIEEMFKVGIDPTRKYENGDYVYYFVSYQQMLRSDFEFKPNSLLILDEAHNLRNFGTKGIKEKQSARKWVDSGDYSLVGNVLARKLLESENKFLRTIFMTGTLFVNSPADLESIMSLGYKKRPLLNYDKTAWELIQASDNEFKMYYEGILSFYRIAENHPSFPTKKYHFIGIDTPAEPVLFRNKEGKMVAPKNDTYFLTTRNEYNTAKNKWVVDFLKKHKGERTLIYSQFLGLSLNPLFNELNKNKIKYGVISGEFSQAQKKEVESLYNSGGIDVLIFTLSIKEGVSFKRTDNIIMIQPYWNYAITEQILARGIRLNSHPKGSKETINLYLLVGFDSSNSNKNEVKLWFDVASSIMNNDIKKLKYPVVERLDKATGLMHRDKESMEDFFGSRDINMYNRMFNKQEEINRYEKRLLSLPRFEDVNNNENNEFIKDYNAFLIDKDLSNKQKILIKKEMYNKYYSKEIQKINSRIIRFEGDAHFKENRNPELETIVNNREQKDVESKVKKLVDEGASLDKIFKLFNIDKTEITTFQANFTPENEIIKLLKECKIEEDTRPNLKILEPTAGIGNIVGELLKLKNASNFMIDANEYHNVFYQVGKAIYSGVDNVCFFNIDFLKFQNKYNYDWVIGNPPFNLRSVVEKNGQRVDKTYYDVDFVARAYNLLADGGHLAMIISTRHQRQPDRQPFKKFNQYVQLLGSANSSIVSSGDFKESKGVTKEMTTNYGMEIIILKKLPNCLMTLDGAELLLENVNSPAELKKIKKQLEKTVAKAEQKVDKIKPEKVKKEKKPRTKKNKTVDEQKEVKEKKPRKPRTKKNKPVEEPKPEPVKPRRKEKIITI